MSGFQNAAALLLLLVQLGNLFGFDKATPFVQALKDTQHAEPLSLAMAVRGDRRHVEFAELAAESTGRLRSGWRSVRWSITSSAWPD